MDVALKVYHPATGIDSCASGHITKSPESAACPNNNLVVASANVVDLFELRLTNQEEDAHLEHVCSARLQSNVKSLGVLPSGEKQGKDRVIVLFEDSHISVLEFDDSLHSLVTCLIEGQSMFRMPSSQRLQDAPRGSILDNPLVKAANPGQSCAAVNIYGKGMMFLKAKNGATSGPSSVSSHIHTFSAEVKDFVFLDGCEGTELYTLHKVEPYYPEFLSKGAISKFSVSTNLHPQLLTKPFENVPPDAYQLLAVPAPLSGVLVVCKDSVLYYTTTAKLSTCKLNLKKLGRIVCSTWLRKDHAMLSTESGEQYMLTLEHINGCVSQLNINACKSTKSVPTSGIATLGNSFIFLGSCLEDSRLFQFHLETGSSMPAKMMKNLSGEKEKKRKRLPKEVESKDEQRLFRDDLKERDSLITVGPFKDTQYLVDKYADNDPSPNGLVCCSGNDKNGFLCLLRRAICPEIFKSFPLEKKEECKGLWTVYRHSSVSDESAYHGYLIVSYETFTQVVDLANIAHDCVIHTYQERTICAANLFGRQTFIQVYSRGARIFGHTSEPNQMEFAKAVKSVSIQDPYVLLLMTDGSIQLLVGDPSSFTLDHTIDIQSTNAIVTACTLYSDGGKTPFLKKIKDDSDDTYLLVTYETGNLQILDLSGQSVFTTKGFASGRSIIEDIDHNDQFSHATANVVELAMYRWNGENSRPFLLALLDNGTVLCYHAYIYVSRTNTRLANLKFLRVSLDCLVAEVAQKDYVKRLTKFQNVGGYHGFYLTGPRPTWFMKCRERLRIHRQMCDEPVNAFAAVHIDCCKHGFIYASKGTLRFCNLPKHSYDNHWPVVKVPLDANPHHLTFCGEKNMYPLIVSTAVQGTPLRNFEVRIVDSIISFSENILMQTCEQPRTVEMVKLFNTTTGECQTLLAIGTVNMACNAWRVVLVSVDHLHSQEVCSESVDNAISAIASVQGKLLVSSGTKLIIYEWTGSVLSFVAEYDDTIRAVSLNVNENMILIGDIHKSIYVLLWGDHESCFTLVGKARSSHRCLSTGFLIEGTQYVFTFSDDERNVHLCNYGHEGIEEGTKFDVGAPVNKFLPLQTRSTSLLFCTQNGSIGCLAPLSASNSKLLSLQQKIPDIVSRLNPKAFRNSGTNLKVVQNNFEILDCDLLLNYIMLPFEQQLALADDIGMTHSGIISLLKDVVFDTGFL